MRVFLDENVNLRLAPALTSHMVESVSSMGWSGMRNGEHLDAIEGKFDAFITHDKGFESQHDWSKRRVALIVIDAKSMRRILESENVARILQALEGCKAGAVTKVTL